MLQYKKNLLFFFFVFIGIYFIISFFSSILSANKKFSEIETENYENDLIIDEIDPICNGISYEKINNLSFNEIKKIDVSIYNKENWFEQLFEVSFDNQRAIDPKYKKNFEGMLTIHYEYGISCSFEAKFRISGDWDDHINAEHLISSLDVTLKEGNIKGVTKFKLFLPETRNGDNEIVVTTLMRLSGFISPRTFYVVVNHDSFNNVSKDFTYIFQEKISKEMLEHNNFREGPIYEANESFRWNDILNNKFKKNNTNTLIIAKLVNNNWASRTNQNAEIAIEGLEMFNKAIFNSYNSEQQLNYNFLGSNPYMFYSFDAASLALLAEHGMTNHNRSFFYNKLENQFYPVYYDGNSNIVELGHIRGMPEYEMVDQLSEGAKKLISKNRIDYKTFYDQLLKSNLEIQKSESDYILNKFYGNLENIANFSSDKKVEYKNFKENNKQIVYEDGFNYLFYDIKENVLQNCNFELVDCKQKFEIEFNKELFSKKVEIENWSGFLFGSNVNSFLDINSIDLYKEINLDKNIKLRYFGEIAPKINIDNKLKTLEVYFSENNQKLFIYGPGKLNSWKITANAEQGILPLTNRQDSNLLTGCITLYNLEVSNSEFKLSNLFCEDALNIINSSGDIKIIEIDNSYADSLDIDFSNIQIKNIEIDLSGNDCLDLSSGNYTILNSELKNCKDKALSAGESSVVNIETLDILNSVIGVAVKDSSSAKFNNLTIVDVEMCLAVYRKKQEFGPSSLEVSNLSCKSLVDNFVQRGSLLNE